MAKNKYVTGVNVPKWWKLECFFSWKPWEFWRLHGQHNLSKAARLQVIHVDPNTCFKVVSMSGCHIVVSLPQVLGVKIKKHINWNHKPEIVKMHIKCYPPDTLFFPKPALLGSWIFPFHRVGYAIVPWRVHKHLQCPWFHPGGPPADRYLNGILEPLIYSPIQNRLSERCEFKSPRKSPIESMCFCMFTHMKTIKQSTIHGSVKILFVPWMVWEISGVMEAALRFYWFLAATSKGPTAADSLEAHGNLRPKET